MIAETQELQCQTHAAPHLSPSAPTLKTQTFPLLAFKEAAKSKASAGPRNLRWCPQGLSPSVCHKGKNPLFCGFSSSSSHKGQGPSTGCGLSASCPLTSAEGKEKATGKLREGGIKTRRSHTSYQQNTLSLGENSMQSQLRWI